MESLFRTERSGTPNAMIVLQGNRQTVITNKEGIGLHLKRSNYWYLKGFGISNSRKENMDEEGIHVYDDSCDNIIRESSIAMTGLKSASHGEAIVVGRDFRHWFSRQPDQSDRNIIINNRLGPGFSTEAIVLNEGSCCGLLARNQFDGNGMSDRNGYGCWVKIKGDRYRIDNNRGTASISEGFMVIRPQESNSLLKSDLIVDMGGCDNIFEHNSCNLQSNGYCIKVVNEDMCGNIVYSDNAYSDGLALTNIPITRRKRSYKLILALMLYFRPNSFKNLNLI
ncbi:unnamed protein product [Medioppia subpectinata]|uniref:Uncharacterized protein n=1 Tax=Medioppia subpectinata TaxID=1979941 RepID=A0A7R9QAR7_9ACAR|nr:unnamed protein product [Medioppia subpectinata]CAG2117501.1 unnamed protein product [Medioppia subpectinata]